MSVIDNSNLGTLWNRILGLFTARKINNKSLAKDITINDEDIPSTAVSGETTVEGALGNIADQLSDQSQQIDDLADEIGDLTTLQTTVKTDVVSAVNENKNAIEERAKLFTTQTIFVCSAGYITGSGNYFDFFIPVACDTSKTYTITNIAHEVFFLADGAHYYTFDTLSVLQKTTDGLFVEIHFTATQTPNQMGVFRGNLTITVQ